MRPTYHQAVVDVVRVYRWTKIYYIYDDNDGTLSVVTHSQHELEK